MVRMIDLIKQKSGEKKSEEPQTPMRSPLSSGEEEQPVRLAGLFGPVAPSGEAPPAAPPPAPPAPARRPVADKPPKTRGKGSVLEGSVEESGSLRTGRKLEVRQRYCPYLGGRKFRERVTDYPTATNVCYAQESQEKKLLRTVILPYAVIAAQRQREFCLSNSYVRCPVYQTREKLEGE